MDMSQKIAVYCGSSTEVDSSFLQVGQEMGQYLAKQGYVLVYGAGSIGLMGELARSVHQHGGSVIGVIPESMVNEEVAYFKSDQLVYTKTMRERKAVMDEQADAFIALPGGMGTLEELIEVITHRQLKFHDKPILIVNTNGFYDPLLALFAHYVAHQFAKPKHLELFHVVQTPMAAVSWLNEWFTQAKQNTKI